MLLTKSPVDIVKPSPKSTGKAADDHPRPNLSTLLHKAWALARAGARRFGGTARQHLACAMRQCWADARRAAGEVAAMKARVLAEVEKIRAERRAKAERRAAAARTVVVLPPRRAYAGPSVTGDQSFLARMAREQQAAMAAAPLPVAA